MKRLRFLVVGNLLVFFVLLGLDLHLLARLGQPEQSGSCAFRKANHVQERAARYDVGICKHLVKISVHRLLVVPVGKARL